MNATLIFVKHWLSLSLLSLLLLPACARPSPLAAPPRPSTATTASPLASPSPVARPGIALPRALIYNFGQYDLIFSPGDFDGSANHASDLLARRHSDQSLWLFANDGAGNLLPPRKIGSTWGAYTSLIAGPSNSILTLRYDGNLFSFSNLHGRLGPPRLVASGFGQFDTILSSADFTGDHVFDLVVRRHADGTLVLYPSRRQGGYTSPRPFSQASFTAYSLLVAPGDWSGDGYADLLARRTSDGTLCLFAGNGQGGLLNSTCTPIGQGWDRLDALVSASIDGVDGTDLLVRSMDGQLWLVPGTGISGYTNPLSLAPCAPLTLYVSSLATNYTIDFERFGTSQPQVLASLSATNGFVQAIPKDAARNGARWRLSATYQDTCSWPSGLYAARLHNHAQVGPLGTTLDYTAYATFIVHPSSPSRTPTILVVASTNTWAAYNAWPHLGSFYSSTRPTQVSYLRPDPDASPLRSNFAQAGSELLVLQWLEAHHQAYSLITDIDFNGSPQWLAYPDYYTVILSTHSEYWTGPMQNALAAYLHSDGHLLSLSGNTMYRVETLHKAHSQDSWSSLLVGGLNPVRTRAQMGLLLGVAFRPSNYTCAPYRVLIPNSWLLAGVHVSSFGATSQTTPFGCYVNAPGVIAGASGWEVDSRLFVPGARTYQVIATGTNHGAKADLVFYQPRSGGSVVNFGSVSVGSSLATDPNLSQVVINALTRFRTQSPQPVKSLRSDRQVNQRIS